MLIEMDNQESFNKLLDTAVGILKSQFSSAGLDMGKVLEPNGFTGLGYCSGYILGIARSVASVGSILTAEEREEVARSVFFSFYAESGADELMTLTIAELEDDSSNVPIGYKAALSDAAELQTPMQLIPPKRLLLFLEMNLDGGVGAMRTWLHNVLGPQYFMAGNKDSFPMGTTPSEGPTGSPFFAAYLIGAVETIAGISMSSEDEWERNTITRLVNDAFNEVYAANEAVEVLIRTIDKIRNEDKGAIAGRFIAGQEVSKFKLAQKKEITHCFALVGLLAN
jgi:hypothetical protein